MEDFELVYDPKAASRLPSKKGICFGHERRLNCSSSKWYRVTVRKLAGSCAWELCLGTQLCPQDQVPAWVKDFLDQRIPQLSLLSDDQPCTLHLKHIHAKAQPVGVCTKKWQALTGNRQRRSSTHPQHSMKPPAAEQSEPKHSERNAVTTLKRKFEADRAGCEAERADLLRQIEQQQQQLEQQRAQLVSLE